jgi:hypothetical protein
VLHKSRSHEGLFLKQNFPALLPTPCAKAKQHKTANSGGFVLYRGIKLNTQDFYLLVYQLHSSMTSTRHDASV